VTVFWHTDKISLYIFICVFMLVHIYIYIYIYIYIHIYIYICMCVCVCVRARVFMYVCVNVYVWLYVCAWTCVCTTLVDLQLDAKIIVYLRIIYLLKSSTFFEHYPAHLEEIYVTIVYMQPLVSSLSAGDCLVHRCTRQRLRIYN
jgi:hypothetical protein